MEEWLGVLPKVADGEDAFWGWEVVFLEVVVKARARAPKVRNTGSCIVVKVNMSVGY